MPLYQIRLINSEFESVEECNYPSLDDARAFAIRAAAAIVADSIVQGEPATAVELQVHCDGSMVARHVVTLSVSHLVIGEDSGS